MQSPISINEVYASGTWWGERKIKSERQTETDSQTHTDRHPHEQTEVGTTQSRHHAVMPMESTRCSESTYSRVQNLTYLCVHNYLPSVSQLRRNPHKMIDRLMEFMLRYLSTVQNIRRFHSDNNVIPDESEFKDQTFTSDTHCHSIRRVLATGLTLLQR